MNANPIQLTDEVIAAINEELAYQTKMAGTGRADTKDNGVPGQILSLERYAERARQVWTDNAGDAAALDQLRKCAAIAVRALVLYGCPRRQPDPITGK